MQSLTWNQPPLALAATPALTIRSTLVALFSTSMATALAVIMIPDNSTEPGALFYPALVMSIGLAIGPLSAGMRKPKAFLSGEALLAIAPIYWLLLDLLQGIYPLNGIAADEIRQAFLAIGLFVVMVWIGALRRPWRTPKVLIRSVSQEFSVSMYFALALACFFLAMLNFAIPCNFNVFEMVHYLGQERWSAPWGR